MKSLLLFLILPSFSFSQGVPMPEIDYRPEQEVYDFVEEEPQFTGGNDSLRDYIARHTVYPLKAIENDLQGIVYVSFVVTKEGKVVDVVIRRGISPVLDAEAKRVVKRMPIWIPGKEKGENVAVNYTVPVHFKFPEVQEKDSVEVEQIVIEEMDEVVEDEDRIENHVATISWDDTDPSFPGGHRAMVQFIAEHLDYSEIDLIAGTVYVEFLVDTAGFIHDIKIRKGLSESADAAVVKMVAEMPQWIPGSFRNKLIAVKMTLPVRIVTDE
jgi:TonB family protein